MDLEATVAQLQQQVQQLLAAQNQAQAGQQPAIAVQTAGALAIPTHFDDGNISEWFEKFRVCAASNQWDEAAQLRRLPPYFSGRAFAIFQRLTEAQRDTVEHLRVAMTEAFLPDEARGAKFMEFQISVLKHDEAVESFVYRLESLLSQALPTLQADPRGQILKQRFIAGLPEDIKMKLLENPTLTYANSIITARQLIAAKKQKLQETMACGFSASQAIQMQNVKQEHAVSASIYKQNNGRSNSNQFQHQFQQQNDVRSFPNNLYRQNHESNDVRRGVSMNITNPHQGKTCYNCGKLNHIAKDCWRKQNSQP